MALKTLKLADYLTTKLGLSADDTDWLIDSVRKSQDKTMIEFFGISLFTAKPEDYPDLKTNNPWLKFALKDEKKKDFSKLLPYEITPKELHERPEEFAEHKPVFFQLFSDFTDIKKVFHEIDQFDLWNKVEFYGIDLDYAVVSFYQLGIKNKEAWKWVADLAFDEYLHLQKEEYDGRVFNEFIVTELKNNGLPNHPLIELIERIDDGIGDFVFDAYDWVQRVVTTMTAMKLKLEFHDYFWYDKVMDILDFTDDYYAIGLNEAKEDDDKPSEMFDLRPSQIMDWWTDFFEEYKEVKED